MSPKPLTRCLQREVLSLRGPDALRFASGMLSCDVKRVLNAGKAPGCGMGFILTNKGKIVSPVTYLARSEKEILLSVPKGWGEKARTQLDHYLIADQVELGTVETQTVWEILDASPLSPPISEREVKGPASVAYDRVFQAEAHAWGQRVPVGAWSAGHEELWLNNGAALPFSLPETPAAELTAWRVEHGVPEWGVDMVEEELPLEFPVEAGISFHKGCFIGQEVVARATFRGRVPHGFCRIEGEAPLSKGQVFIEGQEGAVGELTTVNGSQALGRVRLRPVEEGAALYVQSAQGSKVALRRVESLLRDLTK